MLPASSLPSVAPAPSRPITDAFGTRLSADDVLDCLTLAGIDDARVVLRDDEIVLECPHPDVRDAAVARALVALVARFSPLVQVRPAPLDPANDGVGRLVDRRTRALETVALVELSRPDEPIDDALIDLLQRAGTPITARESAPPIDLPPLDDSLRAGIADRVAETLRSIGAPASVARISISVLAPVRGALELVGEVASGIANAGGSSDGLHLLVWFRPGTEHGTRPAALVAASRSLNALHRFGRALTAAPITTDDTQSEILLDGLAWKVARRPTVAALPILGNTSPLQLDTDRCTDCGICTQVCPTGFLGDGVRPDPSGAANDSASCTRCYECVEACPTDALRPVGANDTATLASSLSHRDGWLSRLAGLPGPAFPAPFPPSHLLPRKEPTNGPRYVLGLSVMTMQEHAAVLLKDGEIVGAIEHEKLNRVRHAGWHPPDRPGITAAMDPTISLEETFCRRPIRALLEQEGITLDDIELFAVNGIHGRHVDHIPFLDADAPIPKIRAGRVVYLPHHLCHAASTYRASGFDEAWVLTIDGRGDRECAALWRGSGGKLELVHTVLSLVDRSIGGVYEGVTRLLGFGSHGQGSVMALASFGEAVHDFSEALSLGSDGEVRIHESAITDAFGALARQPGAPLTQDHKNLAASLQAALEECVVELVRRHAGDGPLDALCIAGGVALNCRLNERLRRTFKPQRMFAQPGANDGGTALGAALEAWADISDVPPPPMTHAYLGPEFSDGDIESVLKRSGLSFRRVDSIADETAERLARGEVVCWFQGRMEFGPRALGARSILADPRRPEIHGRVNQLKDREAWRPFGPSLLAGHEGDWLDGAFDSRFMLFTLPVKEERRSEIPAAVHVDGTTRPQVVHPETSPRYHALLSRFHELTGVPLVLNTSFNRRGEPIVCTPLDAVEAFVGLGADALAIGDFIVERTPASEAAPIDTARLAALPGGRRLSFRLTTRCDLDCGHCTLRDQHGRPDRSFQSALHALAEGREAGCDELVLMRGEAMLRDVLPQLVTASRRMGYRTVQLQTNAVRLSLPTLRRKLLQAGVDAFEVQLLAASEALHDELSGTTGTFRPTVMAIHELVRSGRDVLASVPVLAGNQRQLGGIVQLGQKLGIKRIQFNFPRPVELNDRVITQPLPRLSTAAAYVAKAAELAQRAGMTVSTEAFPFCHLPPQLRSTPDATEDWTRHRIDDLHLTHESVGNVRKSQRPDPPPCRTCSVREQCPRTWALYLELFGSEELDGTRA